MAKKGFSECKGCGISVPTQEVIIHSNKKYCQSCGEVKRQETQDYKELIKTICEYFQIDVPTGLIMKHIKEFKEQFNYTTGGMIYSLWYCKEILNKTFDSKYGLAILKYEYKNAENYFLQQQKIGDSVQSVGKPEERVREIKVNIKKPTLKKELLLDIDSLIKEGEV